MKIDMSHVKPGVSGDWCIEEFEVANSLFYRMDMIKTGRGVPPGKYLSIKRRGKVIMSNTPDEIRDFMPFYYKATGNVLINGLGLGVVLTAILSKKEITKVTIVEKSEDVIKLVSSCFNDERLTIIHADAYDYNPPKGERFDAVWHDIWDDICTDNLPQMSALHKKYGRRTKWQGSWAREICLANERKRRRSLYY